MNCRGWNPHIALYVEGDLEPSVTQQLESHLSMCEECRSFAGELRETQQDLRMLKSDMVDADALNRVRRRVLDRVGSIQRGRSWLDRAGMWLAGSFRWRYAVLGGIALMFVAFAIWRLTVSVTAPVPRAPAIASTERTVGTADAATAAAIPQDQPAPGRHTRAAVPHVAAKKPEPLVSTPAVVPVPVRADAAPAQQAEQNDTVIQILTDDPNIVIYWLVDQTGGF